MSEKKWFNKARKMLKAKKLTYEILAGRLGCSKSAVGHWFTGKRPIFLRELERVAEELGTTVAELTVDDQSYIVSSDDEREWMDIYRGMTQEERAGIKALIRKEPQQS